MTTNDCATRESETSDLRDCFLCAMRNLAATITLVTTRDRDARHGMAATAVASLSADPPALLVCIKRTTSLHGPVHRAKRFCVNLLDQRHQSLFREFIARKGEDRFLVGDWTEGPHELPYLTDAAATLFCSVEQQMDYGTHTIFIGRVENVKIVPGRHPLLYQDGSVGEFTRSV
jgi:flavin reductase